MNLFWYIIMPKSLTEHYQISNKNNKPYLAHYRNLWWIRFYWENHFNTIDTISMIIIHFNWNVFLIFIFYWRHFCLFYMFIYKTFPLPKKMKKDVYIYIKQDIIYKNSFHSQIHYTKQVFSWIWFGVCCRFEVEK